MQSHLHSCMHVQMTTGVAPDLSPGHSVPTRRSPIAADESAEVQRQRIKPDVIASSDSATTQALLRASCSDMRRLIRAEKSVPIMDEPVGERL
jgi:hypothetical protein